MEGLSPVVKDGQTVRYYREIIIDDYANKKNRMPKKFKLQNLKCKVQWQKHTQRAKIYQTIKHLNKSNVSNSWNR